MGKTALSAGADHFAVEIQAQSLGAVMYASILVDS
jgi:hypothetical protein